jgi:hypothetical protein
MARIKVSRNFKVEDLVRDLQPTESELRREGEALVDRVKQRTLSGRDENNRAFEPYAPATVAGHGQRRGRGGRFVSKTLVTLKDTGEMLDDLQVVKVTRKGFGLGFRTKRSEKLAEYHESGAGDLPVRKFLGIPNAWVDEMMAKLQRRRGR